MAQPIEVGHFYMAQLGHYHVAATGEAERLTNLVWRDILKLARTYFEKNF